MTSTIKLTYILSILLFISNINTNYGQNFDLKLVSANVIENKILSKIDYKKTQLDTLSIDNEIKKISLYLKKKGYFLNTIDSITYDNSIVKAYFSLKNKIEFIKLKIEPKFKNLIDNRSIINNELKLNIENLEKLLSSISAKLNKQGNSFSSVQIRDILIKKNQLHATLEIIKSKKRIVDKIEIKGYDQFSKTYLKKYLNIKEGQTFNESVIKKTSNLTKKLNFIEEIKEPEILFTEDSTILYIYIRKKQNNSLDALVNFATQENGDFLLNGNIDLKLNNILNSGEQFKLFWNRIGQERQEFRLSTKIPFIFKSNITPEINFSLYRQDSSFTNIHLKTSLSYNFNSKNTVSTFYSIENSESLDNSSKDILAYTNYFLGINYAFSSLEKKTKRNELDLLVSIGTGSRKTNNQSLQQYNFKSTISYLLKLNSRNQLYINNEIGILESENYLTNELFRIGGANSIRGFNEQSIFTEKYTFINLEYRFITNQNSYLYTITDVGGYKQENKYSSLVGLGFGYLFGNKNYTINLALAAGKIDSDKLDIQNAKFLISWINYF